MASTTLSLLLITVAISLSLSLSSVAARPFHPCNTLIISTYSFSLLNPNPNPNFPNPQNRPHFILVSTDLRPYNHHHFRHRRFMVNPLSLPRNSHQFSKQTHESESESESFSSLKDRTKDILSVVASLVFGAVCGALTAGTMYLVWLIFNHRNDAYRSLDGFHSDDDDDNDDDDIFNPKKKGYVAIPAAPAKAVESTPAVAVVAKESASA